MNVGSKNNADSGILSESFGFIHGGYYHWQSSSLNNRGASGDYWSSYGYSTEYARYQSFSNADFYPQNGNYKGRGFAVRCVEINVNITNRKAITSVISELWSEV
ncbi:hypothetical protein IKG02_02060 [Candidatus Saccharibacteria bacterium]|nr:hypothetical protein [Candidatus Saccharibacteria bacterium]